jgi:tRNA 5-methylaminomethyl-2-thiouridine biosynthesis bifunctional protein
MPIVPATLAFAADGTPYSEAYGDVYHSTGGGLAQARHVFLAGNRLPQRWAGRDAFTILETGFGLGLNFLASWQAWRNDPQRCRCLHFLAVEKHPFCASDLATLHARHPELALLAAELHAQWPLPLAGFHRLAFDGGRVTLTLAFGEAIACVPQFVAQPQAIYLDGFSPAKNPELWSAPLLREIAWLAAPAATLATWSVAAGVREALGVAGFIVERRPGFGAKREMLVGHLPTRTASATVPSAASLAAGPEPAAPTPDSVAVIGAGLAGALVAERLAARGLAVTLFERHGEPAQETSGNLAAAMLPVLSLDDARLSRLNRAAFLHGQRQLDRLGFGAIGAPVAGRRCGVLYLARDAAHAARQQEIVARNGFPAEFVRCVGQDEASRLAGLPVAAGGWWFPGGGYARPADLCRALLAGTSGAAPGGTLLTTRYRTPVATLAHNAGRWLPTAADGTPLGDFAAVVLAGATDILELEVARHLPLFRFRGQVTHLPATALPGLQTVVCREGYLTPAQDGLHCVGASFHRGGTPALRNEDHQANLDRLERMLPGTAERWRHASLAGRVGFRPVSPDKLPIVGRLQTAEAQAQGRDLSMIPRLPGLFVATGYGARGLVWAPLMAEQLAAEICGEPLPVEADLAGAIDPARFVGRTMRERGEC